MDFSIASILLLDGVTNGAIYALLGQSTGLSPWLTLFIGLGLTTACALVLALLTLKMSGHYLPLATIAWGLSLYDLMGNLDALGKYDGMLGIALVPEKREMFGALPVEDNLVLGGFRQMRLGNARWRDRLADVYDLFPRLKERRLQLAGTLSGGERQMLAVGRSLMSRQPLDAGRARPGPGAAGGARDFFPSSPNCAVARALRLARFEPTAL